MSLVAYMLRRAFADQTITLGLFHGSVEVTADGYERIPVRWQVSNRTVATKVTIGPYRSAAAFDRYVLFDADGQPVEELVETDYWNLPPGATVDVKPELVIG